MKTFWIFLLSILTVLPLAAEANNQPTPTPDPKNTVLIFVSFSMPSASLSALLWDAYTLQAPVLIQGLVDNTFQSTFLHVSQTVQEAGGGGMSIDPVSFKKYQITHVPSVVVLGEAETCWDKISGDIPLLAALNRLNDQGECHASSLTHAITVLEKGGDAHV